MSLNNSYKDSLESVKQVIAQITSEMSALNAQATTLANSLNKIATSQVKNNNAVNQAKQIQLESEKLVTTNNKLTQSHKNLAVQKNALTKIQAQEKITVQALNKARRTEATAISKVAGAYANLRAKQALAKKTLQDLIVANGKNNKQTKIAQREYDKLTRKVNQANRATSNFARTGLGKMATGFRNLLGAFGLVGGLMLLRDFTQAVFKNLKTLDKLDFSLRAVIKNEGELIRTREYLNRITILYGAELVSTTERYIKFETAARQSGLALQETEKIFETMTEAAGVMGLKTDELTGIYLALEQMLSKGKVTTEELRRQLGERLPGAFGIMADALGVTTVELDKMLKTGKVLSAEVLPLFAEEVQKAFGLDTIEKVETLQASTVNLTSSWQMLIEELRTGSSWISTGLRATFEGFADNLRELRDLMRGTEGVAEDSAYATYFKAMQENIERFPAEKLKRMLDGVNGKISGQQVLVDDSTASWLKFIGVPKRFFDDDELNEEELGRLKGAKKAIEAIMKLRETESKQHEQDRQALINKLILKDKNLSLEKLEAMSLKELRDLWIKLNNAKEDGNKKSRAKVRALKFEGKETESLKKTMDEQIANYEKLLKLYPENSKEAKLLTTIIESLKSSYDSIGSKGMDAVEKWSEGFTKAKEELKKLKDELEEFFNEFKSDFFDEMGFEFLNEMFFELEDGVSKFSKLWDAADEGAERFGLMFNTITEIGQEAFNFLNSQQSAYFDAQYSRLEQQRDIAIQFAGESTSAREEIERQYEERRKQIARREAESQKKLAMFNIGIDTAQAIMSIWAHSPDPSGLSQGAMTAIIAGIGAAKLAMVASTKVPEFFRGTENAPEGWAKVDEKVPEVHVDSKGNIKSFGEDKANFRFLNRGDKIYSSREKYFEKELGGVMDMNGILPYKQMFNVDTPRINIEQGLKKEDFVRHIQSLEQTIKEKESTIINIDKNGFRVRQTLNGITTERLNNIQRLKGINV